MLIKIQNVGETTEIQIVDPANPDETIKGVSLQKGNQVVLTCSNEHSAEGIELADQQPCEVSPGEATDAQETQAQPGDSEASPGGGATA